MLKFGVQLKEEGFDIDRHGNITYKAPETVETPDSNMGQVLNDEEFKKKKEIVEKEQSAKNRFDQISHDSISVEEGMGYGGLPVLNVSQINDKNSELDNDMIKKVVQAWIEQIRQNQKSTDSQTHVEALKSKGGNSNSDRGCGRDHGHGRQ